ncbi:replication/maintenance protein RepL [Selenomonas infelix]|nr:replication/maintenance protein RepL [Selenomonas infelix]
MAVTRKKVKVVGTETYIKQDTGELREMQVIDIEERDANFHKLWLGHIL